ncbi:MAG TPA: endonuclease/exonuclease/phosphatase family protein [Pirellulales bacterium]|jgi:endonuclease/exonuclease/phosphatase family metal-dependent hydrolase|nr:endonuclease/exonuclease/phosphatase family protein [Pirellulales bacterium]
MRRRHVSVALLTALIYGGYWFLQHFQLNGLDKVSVKPRSQATTTTAHGGDSYASVPATNADTIRMASFNIQVFGHTKVNKPEVMQVLAEIVRKFDLVAIQEVRTDDVVPRFVELINSTGRHYDSLVGPRVGRTNDKELYTFIFDTQSLEVDRSSAYTIDDRDNLFQRPPMVASFRARGPPPEQAFTFTLIDIHTEPAEAESELNALAQVYRAVRNDGHGEDDIILMGDLNADEKKFGLLKQIPNISWVISGVPTNTRGTKTYDNIIFDRTATVEFTGHAGVFDVMREFNLTLNQALEVSDHFPIWAEFSAYEGGARGRLAEKSQAVPAR